MTIRLTLLSAALLAGLATPAAAQKLDSAYTDVDFDLCTMESEDEMGASFACEGYDGIPVTIAEGDLRFFVSYGEYAEDEKAARQTPPPFNYLGKKIEWRLADGEPFATILRFFVSDAEGTGESQILIVTRLEEGDTCHVAYVDASSNRNANELARQAADDLAPDFDCDDEPLIVGTFNAWDY